MGNVRLWELSGAALIVPCKSGVVYTNQVNGTACEHPECEGILIPINNDGVRENFASSLEAKLCGLFDGTWDSLDQAKADEIDKVLGQFNETNGITVDRAKLTNSVESWVYVTARETEDSCYSNFGEIQGILTWQNSD